MEKIRCRDTVRSADFIQTTEKPPLLLMLYWLGLKDGRHYKVGFLELARDNIDEICDQIVTVDETWVRQYDPNLTQESIQWTKKEKSRRRNSRHEQSYRSDVGSYRAVFYKTMHLSTAQVSRQALKDTGFSEIDPPTAQI
ncbi:hypothetical protein EVAR_76804_1 [Eumeta japonica]|uniref:Histone-lysine N-methyltransferase SETMAR n=1 Tax=Eumeta variegata TaxID=151549 RepID=A0A4C1ST89_EUMVA|nr:hypothetical protein EVAR_76804_1 [Eumeta japonica]